MTEKKENPFINIIVNLLIPIFILSKLTKDQYLGFFYGFILALAFPLLYGLYDLLKRKKINFFSLLGLINTLLTGGIGLLELDKFWMVFKEGMIPFLIGVFILVSQKTRWPLVKTFLNQILDLKKIHLAYCEKGEEEKWKKQLGLSSFLLGVSFFISALLNIILAQIIIQGTPGTPEFAQSLADLLKYSFPAIALPMTIITGGILYFLLNSIKKNLGFELEEIIRN